MAGAGTSVGLGLEALEEQAKTRIARTERTKILVLTANFIPSLPPTQKPCLTSKSTLESYSLIIGKSVPSTYVLPERENGKKPPDERGVAP